MFVFGGYLSRVSGFRVKILPTLHISATISMVTESEINVQLRPFQNFRHQSFNIT